MKEETSKTTPQDENAKIKSMLFKIKGVFLS